jgi:Cys-rich repeat protein
MFAACGGRTDLGDETAPEDGSVGLDVVLPDGGIVPGDSGGIDAGQSDGGTLPDASPPPDAGTGTPIQCGTTTCDSDTEVCCVTFMGQTVSETCTSQTACSGFSLTCSSAQNCDNGEVCCASFPTGAQCAPACKGGFQNPQLCASSSECPKGQTCQTTPFGYKICRP